eukprot:7170549-Pyramimonas_sp.AAC.1
MGQKDSYFCKRITVELAQGWAQDAGALQHLDDDGFQASHRLAQRRRRRTPKAAPSAILSACWSSIGSSGTGFGLSKWTARPMFAS